MRTVDRRPVRIAERPPEVDPAEQLRLIRETMLRSGCFTAVSGRGSMVVGALGLAAAALGAVQPTPLGWLAVWLTTAVVAASVGGWATHRKALRTGTPLLSGVGRKFTLALLPSLAAGAVLTAALVRADAMAFLPGLWLLLFGVAVTSAGAFSVRIVPIQGLSTMALGTAALLAPPGWGDGFLAVGFGLMQMGFGFIIARRYGG